MARPKKGEESSKDPGTLHISREEFLRTRDAVVTGLATLECAVQDLSRAYILHTSTVLGNGTRPSFEVPHFTNPLGGGAGLFGGPAQAAAAVAPEQSVKQEPEKKRKRAPHDKNAPKRPRTPYFLYMQFARDGIAREMGSDFSNKQVQEEGTRRWNSMAKDEKEQWAELYGCNYAAYKRKVKAYKAGLPIPEYTTEESRQLFDEDRNIGAAPAPTQEATSDHGANVNSDKDSDATSSSSDDDESPEPPKVVSPPKSPRASKRGKGAKGKVVETKASPVEEAAPVEPTPKSPETERKKKATRKNDTKVSVGSTEPKQDVQVDSGSSPVKAKKAADAKPARRKRKSEALDF
ncbi:MAG: hypothetical protein Q9169_001124 [Polycauliona sp. 2 TL-2023]